ncbi:MAG: hypothetical protein ABI972_06735 [Acidobacteriota bacterium]
MPIMPAAVVKQAEIASAVADVERLLAPDVVRIRHEIATDWSGDWALYFRIVLSDDASKYRLRDVATKVESQLAERLDLPALGMFAYHNFRSESEQAVLKEEAWA